MYHLTQAPSPPSFSPFRATRKPSPDSSGVKSLDLIARSFDESLLRRLKVLAAAPEAISLSWLSLAVDFLSSAHAEAKAAVAGLNPSAPDESLARYLDESVKLLDICNSISSEIERLRQRRLLVNFVLHLVDPSPGGGGDSGSPTPEKIRKARDSLADWEDHRARGRPRRCFETSIEDLIRDLAADLGRAPRGKSSTVGKLVRRTFYGVGLVTVFVSGVLASAIFGSRDLPPARAPAEFLWADSFNSLESAVRAQLNRRLDSGTRPVLLLREIVEADARVRRLRDVIDDASGREADGKLNNTVKEVREATEAMSEGLDGLCDGVNGLFQTVLGNRSGMLGSFVEVEGKQQLNVRAIREVKVNSS